MSDMQTKANLQAFRIVDLPHDFYYIPNFISIKEEDSILQKIPSQRWTQLTHRRLQAHPSTLTTNNTLLASPLPIYLTNPIIHRFQDLGVFDQTPHHQPNHVLINEYKPGEGIMPHEDGCAYAPVVATVSLGGAVCLDISSKPTCADDESSAGLEKRYTVPTRILQEPRSLLITTGAAYGELLHGVAAVEVDDDLRLETVAKRVSLTYRDVLKVSSAASKVLGGLGKR